MAETDRSHTGVADNDPLSILPQGLGNILTHAIDDLKGSEGPVRVITHYDGDGIAAGAVLFTMLERMGRRTHLSFIKGLNDKVWKEQLSSYVDGGEGTTAAEANDDLGEGCECATSPDRTVMCIRGTTRAGALSWRSRKQSSWPTD